MMNLMVKPTDVSAKATRRRFTTAEKIRILREADACAHEKGAVAALLRREGLYSSHLTNWRKQRDAGQFGKAARKRGPVATPPDPRDKKIAELERSLRRVQAERDRYERLCALQKSVGAVRDPAGDRGRNEALMQIVEATSAVDGIEATCDALGVCRASYYRSPQRRVYGPRRQMRCPRSLLPDERREVLELFHEDRFADLAPAQVYATLLDEGRYLCSERTMYRVLTANHEVRERRAQLMHPRYEAPELLATKPNQLWSWDITKLKARRRGRTSTCT
jgi:transposase-like protein